MIKLFRKIRQAILAENKISKYLIYAIGEIILVVIGILIALQINNWNEQRKTVQLAKNYLTDIKKDLIRDTLMFHVAIDRLDQTIANNELLLNTEMADVLPEDSLFYLLSYSFHSTRVYHIDNASYLKLTNTGFLEPEVYNSVFAEINNYYNKEFVAYSEFIEWDEEQTVDIYQLEFLGRHRNLIDLQKLTSEYENVSNWENLQSSSSSIRELIHSIEFRNMTWANYKRKELVLGRVMLQMEIAGDLIAKIEDEL